LALVSELIIRSALSRKESRGLHYIADYPHKIEDSQPTIMTPKTQLG
jgi:L-aspartate oxidase